MVDKKEELRWVQRFRNFERAFFLLKDAMNIPPVDLSDLEKEGIVQRFEYTFELAWKTLKDYMAFEGHQFDTVSPRRVLKTAFSNAYLQDGNTWIEMIEQRNLMSHTYDSARFETILDLIRQKYLGCFEALYNRLRNESF